MIDAAINEVILKLSTQLSDQDLRLVRDTMQMVLTGYRIEPVKAEVVPYEYKLPDVYGYYMAAKTMDGRMSVTSRTQYKICLERMLYRLQLPVDQITANHLRAYILEISQKPDGTRLAPSTLNQRKSIIRSFFQWLAEEEYITKNPALRLHHERVSQKPEPVFTDIQMEQIRGACTNQRDKAIISILISSGMRITECMSLKRADVDLDQREAVVLGKGRKYRTTYFDARTEFDLRTYLSSRTDDSPYLFVTLKNPIKNVDPDSVRDRMWRIARSTGIAGIHPHRFRHTMATNLVEAGCDVTDVQQMLGHASLNTTMHYTHTSKAKTKSAHRRYVG